jgi:transcriptional regulator
MFYTERLEFRHLMAKQPAELLKGTLDLMILRTLRLQPRHGLGIADRLAQITRGTFAVRPGSLFPALYRLERDGFIVGEWSVTDQGRRARFYRLTAAGQRKLAEQQRHWARIAQAMDEILASD